MKILALRERFMHMGRSSGYDTLYQYLPQTVEANSIFCDFKKIYPRGVGRLLTLVAKTASSSTFYNAQSVESELRLLAAAAADKYDIVHYTYGEPYWGLGSILKSFGPAVLITNHQPVSWWMKNERLFKKYKNAHAVIALSEYDRNYFNAVLDNKATCIPHGVDTDFFKPGVARNSDRDDAFRVIFAGRYLRDMPTLARTIKNLTGKLKNIQFDIVYIDQSLISENYLIEIMALKNVTWHAGVSDVEFLNLYNKADCCLLPLEDCTANNALLEAMSCGLPIISTELPAISTYLDDSMSFVGRKGNADDLCDAISLLYQHSSLRSSMAASARKKAVEKFSWNIIASHTINLFHSKK